MLVNRLSYLRCRYDEYLDSKITATDMMFLGARDLSRQLVEHGHVPIDCNQSGMRSHEGTTAATRSQFVRCRYHSTGYIDVTRVEFLQRKKDTAERRRLGSLTPKIVCAAPPEPEGRLMQVRVTAGASRAALPWSLSIRAHCKVPHSGSLASL